MNILEIFARIGLKADTTQGNQFLKTVKGIKSELESVVFGALSVAAAIKAVNSAMAQSREFKKFTADTGESAEELQKWANVAETVSGAGDSVASSIRAIVANQEKIKLGQGNISGYQLLGIDPRSNPFQVLEQLRTKLQNVSPGMRRNIAAQFGVSSDLVQTLELSNAEFDKMASRAWIIPQSNIDGLNRAVSSLSEVKNAFKFMQAELATKLAPIIEKATRYVINFAQMIERGVLMLDKMIRATIGWKAAVIAIVGALAVLNSAFLLSPMGLFTAGIILLLAILDDLYVYSTKSGRSVFGLLVKEMPALGKAFEWVQTLVKNLGELFGFFTGNKAIDTSLDALTEKFGAFGLVIWNIIDAYMYLDKLLKNPLGALKEDLDKGKQQRQESWDRIKKLFSGEMSIGDMLKPYTEGYAGAGTNTTYAPTIVINGATDLPATEKASERALTRSYQSTQSSRSRGGMVEE